MGDLALEDTSFTPERLRRNEERSDAIGRRRFTAAAFSSDGTLAGYSDLFVPPHEDRLAQIGITMVLPEHRGHPLGLAMKLATHRALAAALPAVRSGAHRQRRRQRAHERRERSPGLPPRRTATRGAEDPVTILIHTVDVQDEDVLRLWWETGRGPQPTARTTCARPGCTRASPWPRTTPSATSHCWERSRGRPWSASGSASSRCWTTRTSRSSTSASRRLTAGGSQVRRGARLRGGRHRGLQGPRPGRDRLPKLGETGTSTGT